MSLQLTDSSQGMAVDAKCLRIVSWRDGGVSGCDRGLDICSCDKVLRGLGADCIEEVVVVLIVARLRSMSVP